MKIRSQSRGPLYSVCYKPIRTKVKICNRCQGREKQLSSFMWLANKKVFKALIDWPGGKLNDRESWAKANTSCFQRQIVLSRYTALALVLSANFQRQNFSPDRLFSKQHQLWLWMQTFLESVTDSRAEEMFHLANYQKFNSSERRKLEHSHKENRKKLSCSYRKWSL